MGQKPPPIMLQNHAFDAYYALGPQRSFRKLAKALGGEYNHTTLARWAKKLDWDARIKERDAGAVDPGPITPAHTENIEIVTSSRVALGTLDLEMGALISKVNSAICNLFEGDESGNVRFKFPVESPAQFAVVVGALKDLVTTQKSIMTHDADPARREGKGYGEAIGAMLKTLNPGERIAFLKGEGGRVIEPVHRNNDD